MIKVGIDIDADAQYDHAFCLHASLHGHQGRKFFHARRTLGGPEIQYDYVAAKLAQCDLAVGILHREIRRDCPNARGARAAVAAGQKKEKQQA